MERSGRVAQRMSSSSRKRLFRCLGGVVAAGLAALALAAFWPGRSTLRQQLLAISGRHRLTPGRLAEESRYRPWGKWAPDPAATNWAELERAALLSARENPTRGLPDLSVYQLLSGKTGASVAGLELAAARPDAVPGTFSDLSAVYLTRFEEEGDPLDLLRSIQASERGLALAADDQSLLFNHAQALTRLGTRTLATSAWQTLLDRDEGWREEATAELERLRRPSAEEEWKSVLPELESPATSRSRIVALVERMPWNARMYAEEILLPRWAAAVERGDLTRAGATLELASVMAEILERSRGEELLADSVEAIRRTMERGSLDERRALLDGLQTFGKGAVQYQEQNLTTAKDLFARAASDLGVAGSPQRYWARFYISITEYNANADAGLAILDALLDEIPQDRYPALTGRIEWIAGSIDKIQGRIQSAVRRYQRAEAALDRAGGKVASAFASVLLAEAYSLLGEHSLGWQTRMKAFQAVPYTENLRRNVAMWGEAKGALLHQGQLELAGPFVQEAVAVAEKWGRPLGFANAYLDRAGYWLAVGAREGASLDLRAAQAAVGRMERGPLRDQMADLAMVIEGLYYQTASPARSADLFERGLASQASAGNRFDAVTYTTAKAAAQMAAGDVEAGKASYEESLSLFEQIRATVEDPVTRMQAFRQAQPAFDSLIRLSTSDPAVDREVPFLLAERSRARVLLDLRTGSTETADIEFARLSELERTLPDGVALASYSVLEDRVLVWVVEGGRARLLTLPVDRRKLARAIERYQREMARNAEETDLRRASAPLYDALIRPLGLAPNEDGSLIVVPDRWLSQLPFAGLFDRAAGRYLIEQRTVTLVPSATLLLKGRRKPAGEPRSILAVGVSRPGFFEGKTLRGLPQAEPEASQVSSVYEQPTVLLKDDATRENFLRSSVSNDVLHFAGHAVVDLESPRRSVLMFAGQSGEALEPLTLGELFDAGLGSARLVVLSACRAQDSLAEDREGVLGIAGAFFAAGVPEVLASPWDVNDRSSLPVMVAFHREYRKSGSAGVAFRRAVLGLLRSGPPEDRTPAAWGGFTVISGSFH
jgi:CHAT domain-containing protein